MKKELEIRQQLKDSIAQAAIHKALLQNEFVYRGTLAQNSYFFDDSKQTLAQAKIKFRIRNSLDENNKENILLTLKIKNMQINNGIREAKEYETWLHKKSKDELLELNEILKFYNAPLLMPEIFELPLDKTLTEYMNKLGYEVSEIIKNKRSFYKHHDAEATIDEFYSNEKGEKLTEPQINIEIESDNSETLQQISTLLGLNKEEHEQDTWWDACKERKN